MKGRQYLVYRSLFKDAGRLTFGAGLIDISWVVNLLHCADDYIYIHQQVREKKCRDTASQKPNVNDVMRLVRLISAFERRIVRVAQLRISQKFNYAVSSYHKSQNAKGRSLSPTEVMCVVSVIAGGSGHSFHTAEQCESLICWLQYLYKSLSINNFII